MTMPLRLRIAGACMLLAITGPAVAQTPPADQIKAAREVIDASGAAGGLINIVPIFFDEARQTFLRTRPEIAKDLDEALKAISPEFEQRREQLMNDIATVYAERFTAQELSEIKAFYMSATGKKLVATQSGLLQSSYEKTQSWSQKMSVDIVTRLRQEMRKRGVEI